MWLDATAPNTSSACISVAASQPVIAIIGDSHAGALRPGVQEFAKQNGWGFAVLTKAYCPPLQGGVTVWRRESVSFAEACSSFMGAAFSRVINDASVKIVILAGDWAGPISNPEWHYYAVSRTYSEDSGASLLALGLTRAVQKLIAGGKQVFIAEDVPYWKFDPARISIIQAIPLRLAIERAIEPKLIFNDGISAMIFHNDLIERVVFSVATNTGARFLRLASAFCTRSICRYRDGNELFYADPSHLSAQGAIHALSPWFGILSSASQSSVN